MPKKISSIPYLSKSRNAEHYGLQERFLAILTAEFAAKYKISGYRANYEALFNKEDEAYLQNQAYADTKEIDDKDIGRNDRYRYVDFCVKSKKLSLNPSEVAAAKTVAYAMEPYVGLTSKPYAENTSMLIDLVKKLQSPEYAPAVEVLGLTSAVTALKAANEAFIEVYSRRANDKLMRAASDKMRAIRPEVDLAFFKCAEAIDALYLINESIEHDEANTAAIGKVIDSINAEIIQFTETLSRRGAGKKVKIDPNKPDDINPPSGEGGGEDDRPVIE